MGLITSLKNALAHNAVFCLNMSRGIEPAYLQAVPRTKHVGPRVETPFSSAPLKKVKKFPLVTYREVTKDLAATVRAEHVPTPPIVKRLIRWTRCCLQEQ